MLKGVFWALTGVFGLIIAEMFIPAVNQIFRGKVFLLPLVLFCLLGIMLVWLTLKSKVKGKQRKFLLLTGWSAVGFLVGVVFHNLFYALRVLVGEIMVLRGLMEILHVGFFLAAMIVCPVGFLIGIIGGVRGFIKKRK